MYSKVFYAAKCNVICWETAHTGTTQFEPWRDTTSIIRKVASIWTMLLERSACIKELACIWDPACINEFWRWSFGHYQHTGQVLPVNWEGHPASLAQSGTNGISSHAMDNILPVVLEEIQSDNKIDEYAMLTNRVLTGMSRMKDIDHWVSTDRDLAQATTEFVCQRRTALRSAGHNIGHRL